VLGSFLIPIQSGSANAIWQSTVALELQGRVFALRRAIGQVLTPLGLALIGPLADRVAEPLMQGQLGVVLAPLLGSGPGANFALVMFSFGLLTIIGAVLCLLSPQIRGVEQVRAQPSLALFVVEVSPVLIHSCNLSSER
jgi:hypothetical protein